MSKVYVRFPKTGLGNMMLVWARGLLFAKLNSLPFYTSSWWGLHWGALARNEKKKRLYWGYFIETSFLDQIQLFCRYIFSKVHLDPPVQKIAGIIRNNELFVFNKVNMDNDLFGSLRDHKELIADELNKIISPRILKMLQKYEAPVIGIHIRRGDFKVANPITANEFFIEGINLARSVAGTNLPVTIFTDANEAEIADIMKLPAIYISEKKPDIADILLLSKSEIMFLSQSSTFSYWAAFLSEAIVVRPEGDWQPSIRKDSVNGSYTEISWHPGDKFSTQKLKEKISSVQL